MPVDRTHAQRALTHSQRNVAAAPGLTAAPPARQDVDSFRARLDDHYVLMTNASAGTYYVGVYNNDNYIKARAASRPNPPGRSGLVSRRRARAAALQLCSAPRLPAPLCLLTFYLTDISSHRLWRSALCSAALPPRHGSGRGERQRSAAAGARAAGRPPPLRIGRRARAEV